MPFPASTSSLSGLLLYGTPKVLGQSDPAAATLTDLYTVPALTVAEATTFSVANRSAVATSFRMAVSVGGGAIANKDYRYYDVAIPGSETFLVTELELGMGAGDKVRIYATLATLSFNLDGWERAV